jgi:2-hydroxy-6-oxonona-2,4-dienedioate hydrolase
MMLRKIALWIAAGLIMVVVLVASAFFLDISRAHQRVRGISSVILSEYGDIEYTQGGSGAPVLVVHGSGGGYDQGELIVDAFLDNAFHWIVPSRFGYLRSTFHEGATFDDQAHAYAALLDHLGIERVAVVAFSHGGPSALLFALLHPERVSSLTLVSTGVATVSTEGQEEADQKGSALAMIFEHDWLYWSMSRVFKKQFMGLMGANDAVIAGLTHEQRTLVERVIEEMNPVSLRTAGANFDNRAVLPGERIAGIQAPTLILHATDDTLQLYQNAEFAAATIPGARLMRFERGGHLLMAVEQATVRAAVQQHIRENVHTVSR